MSEPQARNQPPDGATLERSREDVLATARPLPSDEAALIDDLTEDEAQRFLEAILDA